VRRPRRASAREETQPDAPPTRMAIRPWILWVTSFAVWTFLALATSGSSYELWKARGYPMTFLSVLASEFSATLTYAPLTPIAFLLALRFPVQRGNWVRRSLLHLGFGVLFCIGHIILIGCTPYAYWDAKRQAFASAIWDPQAHHFHLVWPAFERLFFFNIVSDISGTYLPIVLIAHALSYYSTMRDSAIHSAKLKMELARSHLQT